MDLSSPTLTTNTGITPVFGDNVQDLLNAGAINVNPTGIIVVNSTADALNDSNSGVTTLRDAINQANADVGEDLIVFDRSLFSSKQIITLNLGELDITHNLDIIAPRDSLMRGDLVTVSGSNASRVFEIESGATVSFDGLIVANGSTTDDGGGIKNSGTLNVSNSTISNNLAADVITDTTYSTGYGGGIYNLGVLTLNNTTLSGNSSAGNVVLNSSTVPKTYGGGIYNIGVLTLNNTTLSNNLADITGNGFFVGSGGGIYNVGVLSVNNSILSSNSVPGGGGGIYNSGGTVTVSNSILVGNVAAGKLSGFGGGIFNDSGTVTVSNSTLRQNQGGSPEGSGGGIYNSGSLTVSDSTLSKNSADAGGGIYNNGGTVTLSNSTLNSNIANSGGGIYNNRSNNSSSALTLVFSTLTLNSAIVGGGVFNSAFVSAQNTIIALNLNTDKGITPDVFGTFSSNGYNLIGDSTGSTGFGVTGDIVGTSDSPIDPRLAPLDFYGGPTQTFALLPDSPAIDAADPTVDTDPTTDQRGFPRVSNGRADIGAFEFSLV